MKLSRIRMRGFIREELVPYLRDPQAKPLRRQVGEMWRMWRHYRYPPLQYLRSRLYRDDGRDPLGFIPTGLMMKFRNALNRGVDDGPVTDKRRFRQRLGAVGLPVVVEYFAIMPDGRLLDAEDRELTRAEAEALLAKMGGAFVKPFAEGAGRGSFVWRAGQPTDRIFAGRQILVQPLLRQHPTIAAMHPHSINTVRIETLSLGGEIVVSGAVLRIGGRGHHTDHASAGGIAAPIDVVTGRIKAPGRMLSLIEPEGRPHPRHPETGAEVEGVQIPNWAALIDAIVAGAEALLPLRTLGWDVAVGEDHPVLIETNHTWSITPFQLVAPMGDTPLGRAARAYHLTGTLPP